jgi:hypothetical protein
MECTARLLWEVGMSLHPPSHQAAVHSFLSTSICPSCDWGVLLIRHFVGFRDKGVTFCVVDLQMPGSLGLPSFHDLEVYRGLAHALKLSGNSGGEVNTSNKPIRLLMSLMLPSSPAGQIRNRESPVFRTRNNEI